MSDSSELLPTVDGYDSWIESWIEISPKVSADTHKYFPYFGINTCSTPINRNIKLLTNPPIPQVTVGPWLQSGESFCKNQINIDFTIPKKKNKKNFSKDKSKTYGKMMYLDELYNRFRKRK
jgi:hypothetical protein